jgi:hypothetical protein
MLFVPLIGLPGSPASFVPVRCSYTRPNASNLLDEIVPVASTLRIVLPIESYADEVSSKCVPKTAPAYDAGIAWNTRDESVCAPLKSCTLVDKCATAPTATAPISADIVNKSNSRPPANGAAGNRTPVP